MTEIKGYKATLWNGMPRVGHRKTPYEVGKTYRTKSMPVLCSTGFHFCAQLRDVYDSYGNDYATRVFAVTSSGDTDSDGCKTCTNKLRIDRELEPDEILDGMLAGQRKHPGDAGYDTLWYVLIDSVLYHGPDNPPGETARFECGHGVLSGLAERRVAWAQAFLHRRRTVLMRILFDACDRVDLEFGSTKDRLRKIIEDSIKKEKS